MNEKKDQAITLNLAESIRQECLKAVREGFEEASFAGLCAEGAIEYAIDAIRKIDMNKIIRDLSV